MANKERPSVLNEPTPVVNTAEDANATVPMPPAPGMAAGSGNYGGVAGVTPEARPSISSYRPTQGAPREDGRTMDDGPREDNQPLGRG